MACTTNGVNRFGFTIDLLSASLIVFVGLRTFYCIFPDDDSSLRPSQNIHDYTQIT